MQPIVSIPREPVLAYFLQGLAGEMIRIWGPEQGELTEQEATIRLEEMANNRPLTLDAPEPTDLYIS